MFNFFAFENKRCAFCSVFDRRIANCSNFDVAFAAMKKIIQSKKKTIKSMTKSIKKIVKTVFLIFEIFLFVSKSFVVEFSNSIMFDALKRFDFSFVDFSKRQIFSTFVASSFFFFHRNDTSTLIAFLFFELIRINRNLAKFKKKMYSKVSALAKKIVKIAKNVIQLSIVFDDLKKAMKMLKNRLLTMKNLIRNERMMTLFSKINSERKAFVSFAEIADERVVTIESDHENQKNKFIVRERSIISTN